MSTGTKFHAGSLEPLTEWLSYMQTSCQTEGIRHQRKWCGKARSVSLSFVAKKNHHCVTLPNAPDLLSLHTIWSVSEYAWQSERRLSSVQKLTNYIQHRHRLAKRSGVWFHSFKNFLITRRPAAKMQSKRNLRSPAYRKITHLVYVHVTRVKTFSARRDRQKREKR
jgi:hypothetical protein